MATASGLKPCAAHSSSGIEAFQALARWRGQTEPAVEQGSARELRAYRALVSALEETIRSFRAESNGEHSGSC